MNTPIASSDCPHRGRLFICSGTDTGIGDHSHHTVSLCSACGQFNVVTNKNGQSMSVTFTLNDEEYVEAAGQYLRYLNQAEEEENAAVWASVRAVEEVADRIRAERGGKG